MQGVCFCDNLLLGLTGRDEAAQVCGPISVTRPTIHSNIL